MAANIAETRKFEVKTPDVVVKVNPEENRPGRNHGNRRKAVPGHSD